MSFRKVQDFYIPSGITNDVIPPTFSSISIEPNVINIALTPIADLIYPVRYCQFFLQASRPYIC